MANEKDLDLWIQSALNHVRKTILEKQMNRAKNKKAAKRVKKLLETPAPWEAETVNQVAPQVWFKLCYINEAGLYVMNTEDGSQVVRIIFVNDGRSLQKEVWDEFKRFKLQSALAGAGVYQKIKE